MAKEPKELKWIESLLPEEGYRRKPMFGGFAYYIGDKIILVTFESPGDKSYKDMHYDFDIWNGCMFPLEREFHPKALQRFPFLINHPVLPKWLYLPLATENFDELVTEVLTQVARPNGYWGSVPKPKKKKPAKEKNVTGRIDTRKPQMFAQEPAKSHKPKKTVAGKKKK